MRIFFKYVVAHGYKKVQKNRREIFDFIFDFLVD